MPRRWPRPHGTSVSSARTPRPTRSRDARPRERARRGGDRRARVTSARERADRRRSARPSRRRSRPSRSSPTGTRNGAPVASTRVPGPIPCSSPSGISSVRPSRNPTTSAATGSRLRSVADQAHLADLGLQAGGLDDQADQVADEAVAARQVGLADRLARAQRSRSARAGSLTGSSLAARAELGDDDLARALELRRERSRRPLPRRCARRRLRGYAAVGLQSHCSTPPRSASGDRPSAPQQSPGRGVHQHGRAARRSGDAPQRALDDFDDQLGTYLSAPRRSLPASVEREVDRVALDRLGRSPRARCSTPPDRLEQHARRALSACALRSLEPAARPCGVALLAAPSLADRARPRIRPAASIPCGAVARQAARTARAARSRS